MVNAIWEAKKRIETHDESVKAESARRAVSHRGTFVLTIELNQVVVSPRVLWRRRADCARSKPSVNQA